MEIVSHQILVIAETTVQRRLKLKSLITKLLLNNINNIITITNLKLNSRRNLWISLSLSLQIITVGLLQMELKSITLNLMTFSTNLWSIWETIKTCKMSLLESSSSWISSRMRKTYTTTKTSLTQWLHCSTPTTGWQTSKKSSRCGCNLPDSKHKEVGLSNNNNMQVPKSKVVKLVELWCQQLNSKSIQIWLTSNMKMLMNLKI